MKRTILSIVVMLATIAQALAGTIVYATGVQTGTTSVNIGSIPANCVVYNVVYNNTTANAVTGGINLGNVGSATAVLSATAVGASATVSTAVAPTPTNSSGYVSGGALFAAAVTAWNSANITITLTYACY